MNKSYDFLISNIWTRSFRILKVLMEKKFVIVKKLNESSPTLCAFVSAAVDCEKCKTRGKITLHCQIVRYQKCNSKYDE